MKWFMHITKKVGIYLRSQKLEGESKSGKEMIHGKTHGHQVNNEMENQGGKWMAGKKTGKKEKIFSQDHGGDVCLEKMMLEGRSRKGIRKGMEKDWQKRLAQLTRRCMSGDLTGAELDLFAWQREENCPAGARYLLGAILAAQGSDETAERVMHKPGRKALEEAVEADAAYGQLLVNLLIRLQKIEEAQEMVRLVHEYHGHEPAVSLWLETCRPPGWDQVGQVSGGVVKELAEQLRRRPRLFLTLVAAQRIKPEMERIEILKRVGAELEGRFGQGRRGAAFCLAMAELSLWVHEVDEARQWAHRGLKMEPYSAGLAMVLGQIPDDAKVGPGAVEVLKGVAMAHRGYADVQAALIRRQKKEGREQEAMGELKLWLEREPENRTARALWREMAA